MRLLGAVLSGGKARRFGSDKALALLDGVALIDLACASLATVTASVAVVGRSERADLCLADWPLPGLGPLGGLCGALRYGAGNGFTAVLSTACDIPALAEHLLARLIGQARACYVAEAPVVGLWPCHLADDLSAWLQCEKGDLSVRGWAASVGAAPIAAGHLIANINRPGDLEELRAFAKR